MTANQQTRRPLNVERPRSWSSIALIVFLGGCLDVPTATGELTARPPAAAPFAGSTPAADPSVPSAALVFADDRTAVAEPAPTF
jgi:hypothetical protein